MVSTITLALMFFNFFAIKMLKKYVFVTDTIEFVDYKEFLQYIFNSMWNTGKLDDVIYKVNKKSKDFMQSCFLIFVYFKCCSYYIIFL